MKRKPTYKPKDRAVFSKTANKSKKINLGVTNMRGGIRL